MNCQSQSIFIFIPIYSEKFFQVKRMYGIIKYKFTELQRGSLIKHICFHFMTTVNCVIDHVPLFASTAKPNKDKFMA